MWTPPTSGASGYLILYHPSNAPQQALSEIVNDPSATDYLIEGVMAETEYTVQMVAYAELPTSLSINATVYLDGKPELCFCSALSLLFWKQKGKLTVPNCTCT